MKLRAKKIHLAGCAIFDTYGRLLLIHRITPGKVQWELPGGKMEKGESSEAAAVRELREELGIEVKITGTIGTAGFTEDGIEMEYTWHRARITSGAPVLREGKFDRMGYFSWSELASDDLPLSKNTENLVAQYRRDNHIKNTS